MKTEFFHSDKSLTFSTEMVKEGSDYKTFNQYTEKHNARFLVGLLLGNERSREVVKKMQQGGIVSPAMIFNQFKKCNFDAIDNKPDIDENNNLNFEYVECGYKGANKRCPFSLAGDPKPYCIYKKKANVPVN